MATVPLREEFSRWEPPVRPRLVLEDCSSPISRQSLPRVRTSRSASRRWESLLFGVAAAAVLLFFLASFAQSLFRTAASSYQSPLTSVAVLPVTVHPGNTLWTYAQKYEFSNVYILDRVDAIARANHLAPDAALVPGQHLLIPVTDPTKLAQLQRLHLLAQK